MDTFVAHINSSFGLKLTDQQKQQFHVYKELLNSRNNEVNLTAIVSETGIYIKHFLDSASCSLAWRQDTPPRRLVDIGTGAGFPGIVLAILYPGMHVTLIESVGKKARFCQEVIRELALPNSLVVVGRAEELGKHPPYQHGFDCAVSRAVAPLYKLVPLLFPFVTPSGKLVALKGQKVSEEFAEATAIRTSLQLSRIEKIAYTLPGETSARAVVVMSR